MRDRRLRARRGLFAAVAGIALTALVLLDADRRRSPQYTLIALAAVALGGTPLGGGRGGLLGSLLGAVCIYLHADAAVRARRLRAWLNLVYGGLLVAGVVVGAQAAGRARSARAATA